MTLSKDALLTPRLPEDDVELPGLGGTVRVRGLSRGEVFHVQELQKTKGVEESERRMLAYGMLDPKLTMDEVRRWHEASPAGELEPVTKRIYDLSGMGKGASKEAMLDFRGESES